MHLVGVGGGFATVLSKGADEAGAVFFVHSKSTQVFDFYGQVPQALIEDGEVGQRVFELLNADLNEKELSKKVASQLGFDQDCWIVELECAQIPNVISIIKTD